MRGTYTVVQTAVTSGTSAVTLIEVEGAAGQQICIKKAWISNTPSETSEQWDVRICRQSTDGTNVTSPTIVPLDSAMASSGMTARGMCTTQGTVSDTVVPDGFNVLTGWLWTPSDPDEWIWADDAITIGIRVTAPPSSITISCGLLVAVFG